MITLPVSINNTKNFIFNNNKNTSILSPGSLPVTAHGHQTSVSPAYPVNYYLPFNFKAQQENEDIKAFENFLEGFYEQNKNSNVNKIETYFLILDIPLTESKFINNSFINMIRDELKSCPPAPIDEKALTKAVASGFNKAFSLLSDNEKVKFTPESFVEHMKEQKILPEKIALKQHCNELRQLLGAFRKEVLMNGSDIDEQKHMLLFHRFMEGFSKNLKGNNIAYFDEAALERMKSRLAKEPFVSFVKKSERIQAQQKLNNFPSSEKCAQDIYSDMREKNIAPFDNPRLYEFLSMNDEKLDFILEKIYGHEKENLDELFDSTAIDKKHKVLLADPCVGARLGELERFVDENKIDTKEMAPVELRRKFSDYLGTETVYRGLYAKNPDELIQKLKEDGNYASVFKEKDKAIEAIRYYLDVAKTDEDTVFGRIMKKISKPSQGSEFLSVSSVYDIAASVPRLVCKKGFPVVVIKAEVPKLSLIKQENMFRSMQMNQRHRVLVVGDRKFPYDTNMNRIETFVPFYLPTDRAEIVTDTQSVAPFWID
ncbi:MAG: hypothetical protein KHX03_08580 [Clostridium sp.]|nr:hypothetical protein [Clostridium sp.]